MSDVACTARGLALQAGMDVWATIHREATLAVERDPLMRAQIKWV